MTVLYLRTTKMFHLSLICWKKRRAKYEAAADIVVETDGKSELEICEELIHRLREAEANK